LAVVAPEVLAAPCWPAAAVAWVWLAVARLVVEMNPATAMAAMVPPAMMVAAAVRRIVSFIGRSFAVVLFFAARSLGL
jgi:hypothetical protein